NMAKFENKLVINGKLIKWNNAKGDVVDNTITSIADGVFENNQNITSVSFPNVTNIGDRVFNGASNLTNISLKNVQNIGNNTFDNIPNLNINYLVNNMAKFENKLVINGKLIKWNNAKGDVIDNTITSIGDGAFENNQNITSVSFPNVTRIGYSAFKNATNLTSVNMPKLEEIEGSAFEYTPKLMGKIVVNGKLLSWGEASGDVVDNTITSIADGVFENNENIISVSFPNVTRIGYRAFKNATNLTSVNIPKLKEIKDSAFEYTPKLMGKIIVNGELLNWDGASGDIIDNTITSIGECVFENNQNITSVSFPNVTRIRYSAFKNATNLTSVNIPKLKEIEESAFEYTPKLMSKIVVDGELIRWDGASGDIIDDTITSIADGVFENNQNITSVSFPNVRTIKTNVFKGATNLTTLNMPKLQFLYGGALENTPKLKGKIIVNGILVKWDDAKGEITDDTIAEIAASVFENNQSITSVSFPNVRTINKSAFKGATNLASVSAPKAERISLTSFYNATSLRSVSFPNLTSVGDNAFDGATNLSNIYMPKLKWIGYGVFKNTPKLKGKIVVNDILVKWDDAKGKIDNDWITKIAGGVFENNENITTVSFSKVTEIGEKSFYNAKNLTSAWFPELKRIIGNNAFDGATNLTNIYMPKTKKNNSSSTWN
ncbi:leucine-rich repeat domain-containing protein, partial [Mycoplasma sp. HF14]